MQVSRLKVRKLSLGVSFYMINAEQFFIFCVQNGCAEVYTRRIRFEVALWNSPHKPINRKEISHIAFGSQFISVHELRKSRVPDRF